MWNSGRSSACAVVKRPRVAGPDMEEQVGRSGLGRVVAEATPRPVGSGDGVTGRGGRGDLSRSGRGTQDWRCQPGVGGVGAQGGRLVEAPGQ
ncbi:hypothetical protein HispidOSU_014349, partial [Sigmodon hispidus]